jgi:hypothetical protein
LVTIFSFIYQLYQGIQVLRIDGIVVHIVPLAQFALATNGGLFSFLARCIIRTEWRCYLLTVDLIHGHIALVVLINTVVDLHWSVNAQVNCIPTLFWGERATEQADIQAAEDIAQYLVAVLVVIVKSSLTHKGIIGISQGQGIEVLVQPLVVHDLFLRVLLHQVVPDGIF